MKKLILSISLTLIVASSFGQFNWGINFDPPYNDINRIIIDTVSISNCKWQIGHPNKIIFTSAHSIPNAIVTDTLNPVPPNDTSIFYIKHAVSHISNHVFVLHFWYQMNGDPTDRGIIEVSPDSSHNVWINILTQDTTYNFLWETTKPTLTGSTVGWQSFDLRLMSAYPSIGSYILPDTVLFRFTYITDSNITSHDGWMIDDFYIEDWIEGIQENKNDNWISISPNPASGQLTIKAEMIRDKQTIQIIDDKGQLIYNNQDFKGEMLDTRQFKNGFYFLKYSNANSFSIKKFIVIH